MGIWKNLRAGAAFMRDYQQDTTETVPRWARVVRVGRRVLGTVGVDVEIHYGQTPPHVESVSVSVPRGMQLQVGQDVFVVGPKTSSDSSDTTWILDVTRPPQYGSWPTPPEFLTDAPPGAASPAAAPPGLRESRLKILQVHLRQGTITREEYERHLREMGLLRDGPGSSHDTGAVHLLKGAVFLAAGAGSLPLWQCSGPEYWQSPVFDLCAISPSDSLWRTDPGDAPR
jgi:hypothetical protein